MEALVLTHAIPCEIFGGKSDTETGFSPKLSVFPVKYDSTSAPYISSSTCRSY